MISKKDLKDYGFSNMYEYCDMIIESYTNGQKKQVIEQINNMSRYQRHEFVDYMQLEVRHSEISSNECIEIFALYLKSLCL